MMNEPQRWLPAVTLGAILWLTIIGLTVGPVTNSNVGIDVGKGTGALLTGILVAVGVVNLLTVRFLILPPMAANAHTRRDRNRVAITGYAFTEAPAIYGVVTAIFTGEGVLALPFGAIALFAVFVVWSYLREYVETPRTE